MLDGPERRTLRGAILRAFDFATLEQTLAEGSPSRDLGDVVTPGAKYDHQVFQLIANAIDNGWIRQLIATLLEARADNKAFVDAVAPIAKRLEAGETFTPVDVPAAGDARVPDRPPPPMPAWVPALWIGLSLATILAIGVTAWQLQRLPLWAIPPLIISVGFVALGAWGLSSPGSSRVADLNARDLKLVPGIGLTGLILIFTFAGSSVGTLAEVMARGRKVTVIARLLDKSLPLPQREVFAESAASEENESERSWKTTSLTGEATFRLRVNDPHRFGVKMEKDGGVREGAFPSRRFRQDEDVELDVSTIPDVSWIAPGEAIKMAVVQETQPTLAQSVPTDVRTRIASSRSAPVSKPEEDLALRRDRAPLGWPAAPWFADRAYFTLGYDPAKRRPVFVAFKVDTRKVERTPRRSDGYMLDPLLPPEVQPDPDDFRGAGYDRGTLIRRTDVAPPEAIPEIFYYSVVVPQTPQSNQRTWLAIENYTTLASADTGEPIWVIAGPVYRRAPTGEERVLVLGKGATPVPTDLFRILLRQRPGGWDVQAFLAPNDATVEPDPLKLARSLDEIERLTGLNLLPGLPKEQKSTVNRQSWHTLPVQ